MILFIFNKLHIAYRVFIVSLIKLTDISKIKRERLSVPLFHNKL